jgi:N-acetylneuraminate synthase
MISKFGPFVLTSNRPVIIAEAGVNHGGNLRIAKKYIDLCKLAGANAVKFQTYKAETIASKNSPAYWDVTKEKTKSQYNLFKKFDKFNYSDFKKLKKLCDSKKILFMTTLFDQAIVDQYDNLIKVYKISSSDITNIPLLRKIGSKQKPTFLSTGGSNISEINFALKNLSLNPNKVCLMHCILNYPTKDHLANLKYIKTLKKNFPKYLIGYSDHTVADENLTAIQYAFELGASIVEKHFTHNNKLKGNDHYHSMNFNQLKNLNNIYNKRFYLLGNGKKNLKFEKISRKFARRSLYSKIDIFKGQKLDDRNLTCLRPAIGISAKDWDNFYGKIAKKNILKDSLIRYSDIE